MITGDDAYRLINMHICLQVLPRYPVTEQNSNDLVPWQRFPVHIQH